MELTPRMHCVNSTSTCSCSLLCHRPDNKSLSLTFLKMIKKKDVKATLCNFYWATAPSAATGGDYIFLKFPRWIMEIDSGCSSFTISAATLRQLHSHWQMHSHIQPLWKVSGDSPEFNHQTNFWSFYFKVLSFCFTYHLWKHVFLPPAL